MIKLRVGGEELPFIWRQQKEDDGSWGKGDFHLSFINKPEEVLGNIKIPKGSRVSIRVWIGSDILATGGRLYITGEKGMEILKSELESIAEGEGNTLMLSLVTSDYRRWGEEEDWYEKEPGKANFSPARDYSQKKNNLSLREALDLLKKSLTATG